MSGWSGGVPYTRQGNADVSDFVPKMIRLACLDVCCAEDYKQGWAPADIKRDLQARGLLAESGGRPPCPGGSARGGGQEHFPRRNGS